MRVNFPLFLISILWPFFTAAQWEPIREADLALKHPRIAPDADAEAIFWKVWVTDRMLNNQQPQNVQEQYVRIKIFTDRGVESQSTIDLFAALTDIRMQDLRGRTIKSDGRIIELEKQEIFERTVVKGAGVSAKFKSFSMAGVEPGDIIEYRWRQYRDNYFSQYSRFFLQRDIPAWEVTYYIKPSEYAWQLLGFGMWIRLFNTIGGEINEMPGGGRSISLRNVEAFEEESRMPPEYQVRPWLLLFYLKGRKQIDQDKYWTSIGKDRYRELKEGIKTDGLIKQKVRELTVGLPTPRKKIERILDFCLNEIKNVDHDRFSVTAEEHTNLKLGKKPSDTLVRGMGSGEEVIKLFTALLNAAGVQAHIAYCAGRDDSFFNPGFRDLFFLNRMQAAVQLDEEWKFYDPSIPYLEPGMLSWPEEGAHSQILDPRNPVFVTTPLSGPDRSQVLRKAKFVLQDDGTLEGSLEQIYRGHLGVSRKIHYDEYTEQEREKAIEEQVKDRLSNAEISDIEMINVTAIREPFTIRYRVRVPGYGQRIGKRFLLQPSFFKMNVPPVFQTSKRRYDVYFRYAWSERDEVTIEFPEEQQLESDIPPKSLDLGPVGRYEAGMELIGNRLVYRRSFRFGDGGRILFPATAYPRIKQIFDFIHQQDNHIVTLIRKDSVDRPMARSTAPSHPGRGFFCLPWFSGRPGACLAVNWLRSQSPTTRARARREAGF